MATASALFWDYNYYRVFTYHVRDLRAAGRRIPYLKETAERLAFLHGMSLWCEDKGVEDRRWLCWLFYRNKWRFPRHFKSLIPHTHKAEQALLKAYQEADALPMYGQRIRLVADQEQIAAGAVYDCNRDLAASTEALKRRYRRFDDEEGCFEDERTQGYHPKSHVCGQCSFASRCEQKLRMGSSFNVIGLREGEITATQAMGEAATWKR